MSRNRRKKIERHRSEEELDRLLAETDDPKLIPRLIFIKNLYSGDTIEEAATRVGKSAPTGSRWACRWNEGGLERLTPDVGGGRPPKLDEQQRKALVKRLQDREQWQLHEIERLLHEEFGVEYHPAYLREFLRNLGLTYSSITAAVSTDERSGTGDGDEQRD